MTPKVERRTNRGRRPDGKPNAVDVYVGERLRLRRQMLQMSQEKLAEALGLTFQQVQKYEKGINRISCSRLWDFSQILHVPVQFFFMNMPNETALDSPRFIQGGSVESWEEEPAFDIYDNQMLNLVRSFQKINNPKTREHLYHLMVELGKSAYLASNQLPDDL